MRIRLSLVLAMLALPGCGVGYVAGVLWADNFGTTVTPRFDTADSGDADVDADADTDTDDGSCPGNSEISFESFTTGCDSLGFWFDVQVYGISDGAELHLVKADDSGVLTELGHPFPASLAYSGADGSTTRGYYDDEGGCWDNPYLELRSVEDPSAVVPGASTRFNCGDLDRMTFSIVVHEVSGDAPQCASWGLDPTGTYGGVSFGDCQIY